MTGLQDLQDRLEATFNEGGVIGPRLLEVVAQEERYHEYVFARCKPYVVLTDSFLSFFYDTLYNAVRQPRDSGTFAVTPYWGPVLLEYLTGFRSFRAAETLLYRGYPLDGFALLRDLKDTAVLTAALAHGITTYSALNAFDVLERSQPDTPRPLLMKRISGKRKQEEHRVFDLMLRTKSGLDPGTLEALDSWERLFHQETHGSRLTTAAEFVPWIKGEGHLSIGPAPIEASVTIYINRVHEVSWMYLRLLPYLQLAPAAFGLDWEARWTVLDKAFQYMSTLLERSGKPIGAAFKHFMAAKLPFTPSLAYSEAKSVSVEARRSESGGA